MSFAPADLCQPLDRGPVIDRAATFTVEHNLTGSLIAEVGHRTTSRLRVVHGAHPGPEYNASVRLAGQSLIREVPRDSYSPDAKRNLPVLASAEIVEPASDSITTDVPIPESGVASTQESDVAPFLLHGFKTLLGVEARVAVAMGRFLSRIFADNSHQKLGFATFGDMARERLLISPRSADDLKLLYRVLSDHAGVREAFLDGRITACQVLALRTAFTDENEAFWLDRCARLGVRDLKRLAREMRQNEVGETMVLAADLEEEPEFTTVSFEAPPNVVLAWEDALELARRVLGWNAPRYQCAEAILAEAAPEAAPGESVESEAAPESATRENVDSEAVERSLGENGARGARAAEQVAGPPRPANPDWPETVFHDEAVFSDAADELHHAPRSAMEDAWQTLLLIQRELYDLDQLIDAPDSVDPEDLAERIHALQIAGRPFRILLGRLLHDLKATRTLRRLGCLSLEEFAENHLHLSRATAWNLLKEVRLFFDKPILARAYATRRIGVGHAVLIDRIARGRRMEDYLSRAEGITHRQFYREVRFQEKLEDFFPHLALDFPGPLPPKGLERALIEALCERGWTRKDVKEELNDRRLYRALTRANDDPARNPIVLRRLETLLNLLVLTAYDDAMELSGEPLSGVQTFANAEVSVLREDFPKEGGNTLVRARPMTTIRFRAPLYVKQWWRKAIEHVRKDVWLPSWASVTLILQKAMEEWMKTDPERTPTESNILERDGYLCQVPGCSRRAGLEVHHIVWRSHGGGDEDSNLITCCSVHHRILLHQMGSIKVSGQAPHNLTWMVGKRTYEGEKLVKHK